jgi:hypothetical protein
MDDPLVPKDNGGAVLATKAVGMLGTIFILVAIISAFTKVGQSFAWVVLAAALLVMMGTTGVLIRWVVDDELSESKHTYLIGAQALSLLLISGGLVAIIFLSDQQLIVSGCVTGATGGVQLKLGDNPPLSVMQSGNVSGFAFPTKITKGDKYAVTIEQSTTSMCSFGGGQSTGIASMDIAGSAALILNCVPAVVVSGTITLNSVVASGITLRNTDNGDTYEVTGPGNFNFPPHPLPYRYNVTVSAPAGVLCSLSGWGGDAPNQFPVSCTCNQG